MESYAIITEDYLFEDDDSTPSRKGLVILGEVPDKPHPDEERFYLIDDDGIVYYSGRLFQGEDSDDCPWSAVYEYGRYDAGTVCASTSKNMKDAVI